MWISICMVSAIGVIQMRRSNSLLLLVELSVLLTPAFAQQLSTQLRFEANAGQAAANVKYLVRGSAYTGMLDETGLTTGSSSHPIRMGFAKALKPEIEPVDEMNVQSNYYTAESRQWRTDIRNFQ